MSGDQGRRPSFLPPADVAEQDAEPADTAEVRPRPGSAWAVATTFAGALLLVAPFLEWVKASLVLTGLGQAIRQDIATEAGVNADGSAQLIPVLAALAIGMACWGLLAADARISGLAAVPGVLAALGCAVFMLRLGRFRAEVNGRGAAFGSLEIQAGYGWYLALAASLLVTGLSVAGLRAARAQS